MEKITVDKQRNSSIELLRLLLMFVILLFHVIGHGSSIVSDGLNAFQIDGKIIFGKLLFYSFLYFPVDCFVIISGYFGIKLKTRKLIELWLSLFIVSITISIIFFIYKIADVSFIKSMLPLRYDIWWFMTNYFMLCLLSPLLNSIDTIEIKCPKVFLIILICLDFIFHNALANFIICYIIGKMLKRITFSWKEIIGMIFIAVILHIVFVIFLAKRQSSHIFLILSNYSPIIIIQAILIFLIFNSLNFSLHIINVISSVSLYVYLITDHPFIREKIVNYISEDAKNFNFLSILTFTIILFICSLICGGGIKFFISLLSGIFEKVRNVINKEKDSDCKE